MNWIRLNNIKWGFKILEDGQNQLELILIWNQPLSYIIIAPDASNGCLNISVVWECKNDRLFLVNIVNFLVLTTGAGVAQLVRACGC